MKLSKKLITMVIGLLTSFAGWQMRMNAYELAWPDSWSYTGPRENTSWAIKELAYIELGMILLYFGLILVLLAFVNWLWTSSRKESITESSSDTKVING